MSILHIPFYPSDWLAGTRGLSAQETGIYITLIARMYEMAGPIPRDDARLSRLCGCKTKNAFTKALSYLISEGKITDADGTLWCPIIDRYQNKKKRDPISAALRLSVFERDGWACVYCKTEVGPFECDHIHPVSRGGTDDLENLCCACVTCNRSKGAKTIEEWTGAEA